MTNFLKFVHFFTGMEPLENIIRYDMVSCLYQVFGANILTDKVVRKVVKFNYQNQSSKHLSATFITLQGKIMLTATVHFHHSVNYLQAKE